MPLNKPLEEILSDCIATIRDTSIITNIVDNLDNTYTFTVLSLKDLELFDWIKIENTPLFNSDNEKIIAIDSILKTFTISKTSGIVITTFGTYTANSPYFDYGYWLEESNKLTLKGQSITWKNQKFPLIFLQRRYTENRNSDNQASIVSGLQIYILTNTKFDEFTNWRIENTYIPILRPLYKEFMLSLANSSYIYEHDVETINHTYIEEDELGILDGNANKVNQWIDAIALSIDLAYRYYGDCN